MNTMNPLLTEVKRFEELFETYSTDKDHAPKPVYWTGPDPMPIGKPRTVRVPIGPYTLVNESAVGGLSHRSLWVRPTERLVAAIKGSMLLLDRDSLYFEIHVRESEARVIVKHNLIIGSRWVAMIDPKTVPVAPPATGGRL